MCTDAFWHFWSKSTKILLHIAMCVECLECWMPETLCFKKNYQKLNESEMGLYCWNLENDNPPSSGNRFDFISFKQIHLSNPTNILIEKNRFYPCRKDFAAKKKWNCESLQWTWVESQTMESVNWKKKDGW